MKPPIVDYRCPGTVSEAVGLLGEFGDDAKILAGGQSLMPLLNMRFVYPTMLIDVNRLDETGSIEPRADLLVIGATVRQGDAERSPVVHTGPPLLAAPAPPVGHSVPGDPATVEHKDKLYMIQPTGRGGFCHHGSNPAPLPMALDKIERKLALQLGPDGDDPDAKFAMRIYTTGGNDETTLRVRLNHTLLGQISRHDGYVEVAVPNDVPRSGHNELALWCNQDVLTTQNPMIVHEVYVTVTY